MYSTLRFLCHMLKPPFIFPYAKLDHLFQYLRCLNVNVFVWIIAFVNCLFGNLFSLSIVVSHFMRQSNQYNEDLSNVGIGAVFFPPSFPALKQTHRFPSDVNVLQNNFQLPSN